jgi:hypothetical protein
MVLGALAAVFAAVMNLKIFMIWAFSSLNSRQAPPPPKKNMVALGATIVWQWPAIYELVV